MDHQLDRVVDPLGDRGQPPAEIGDEACALLGDRRAHLGRIGDALHQHLGLRAGEDLAPDLVGRLGVEGLDDGARDLVAGERLLQRGLDGVLLEDDPDDRPLDGRAAQRADYRLLGGLLEGLVHAGCARQALARPGTHSQHSRRG